MAVLRWCVSQLLWPLSREEARSGADALVRGLTSRPALAPPTAVPAQSKNAALGWPA